MTTTVSPGYDGKYVLFVYGTRPELIKLFPVYAAFQDRAPHIRCKTLFSGQHEDLIAQYATLLPAPDFRLHVLVQRGQSLNALCAHVIAQMDTFLSEHAHEIAMVVVQGDTSTASSAAIACAMRQVPVAHVEAGLRTHDTHQPHPEETNRVLITHVAAVHFAPTVVAKRNLVREGVAESTILVTGNTIVDAVQSFGDARIASVVHAGAASATVDDDEDSGAIVVTIHRRENWGDRLRAFLIKLNDIAVELSTQTFILIRHPNRAFDYETIVTATNVRVIDPLDYVSFLALVARCRGIISDSGGLQEEVTVLRKKMLVVRAVTERPEAIAAGYARLISVDSAGAPALRADIEWLLAPLPPPADGDIGPFGDGRASHRIVDRITEVISGQLVQP